MPAPTARPVSTLRWRRWRAPSLRRQSELGQCEPLDLLASANRSWKRPRLLAERSAELGEIDKPHLVYLARREPREPVADDSAKHTQREHSRRTNGMQF